MHYWHSLQVNITASISINVLQNIKKSWFAQNGTVRREFVLNNFKRRK